MPHPISDLHQKVLPFAKAGLAPKDIAAKLGVKNSLVSSSFQFLRRHGQLPPFKRKDHIQALYNTGLRMGVLSHALLRFDAEFHRWLADQIPEGSTVSDFAASALFDLYLDEKEEGEGR